MCREKGPLSQRDYSLSRGFLPGLARHRVVQGELACGADKKFVQDGRIGLDLNRILIGEESHDAQETTASLDPWKIEIPVVRLNLMHCISMSAPTGQPVFKSVPGKDQEDVIVLADEFSPDGFPGVSVDRIVIES